MTGQPACIADKSYGILEPVMRPGKVEALATWLDADGKDTGIVALAKVPHGICHSAEWPEDSAGSRALMRAVLLTIEPSWRTRLEAGERAAQAADAAERAWLKSLAPVRGELRSFCCHDPKDVAGLDWNDVIRRLKAGGFNVMEPNVAWADSFSREDAAACLAACRKLGVDCYLWKVCWRPRKGMTGAGRVQRHFDGRVLDRWMCPADPANRESELRQFLDMAALEPAGVILDYIRYDGGFYCACDGCRAEMERRLGCPIRDWRKVVWEKSSAKAKWLDFRRETMTSFVREVSRRIRERHPQVKVHADVIPRVGVARGWFGQDWEGWAREGIVDAVRPMNYYAGNTAGFRAQLRHQVECLKGAKADILPTLGLSEWPRFGNDARRMAEEILAARELGCPGFGVFQVGARAFDVFPGLGAGITAGP